MVVKRQLVKAWTTQDTVAKEKAELDNDAMAVALTKTAAEAAAGGHSNGRYGGEGDAEGKDGDGGGAGDTDEAAHWRRQELWRTLATATTTTKTLAAVVMTAADTVVTMQMILAGVTTVGAAMATMIQTRATLQGARQQSYNPSFGCAGTCTKPARLLLSLVVLRSVSPPQLCVGLYTLATCAISMHPNGFDAHMPAATSQNSARMLRTTGMRFVYAACTDQSPAWLMWVTVHDGPLHGLSLRTRHAILERYAPTACIPASHALMHWRANTSTPDVCLRLACLRLSVCVPLHMQVAEPSRDGMMIVHAASEARPCIRALADRRGGRSKIHPVRRRGLTRSS